MISPIRSPCKTSWHWISLQNSLLSSLEAKHWATGLKSGRHQYTSISWGFWSGRELIRNAQVILSSSIFWRDHSFSICTDKSLYQSSSACEEKMLNKYRRTRLAIRIRVVFSSTGIPLCFSSLWYITRLCLCSTSEEAEQHEISNLKYLNLILSSFLFRSKIKANECIHSQNLIVGNYPNTCGYTVKQKS